MGLIHREGWEVGWDPSADLVKGHKKSLLRADNLQWDERGALSLRMGAATLNPQSDGVPVPMVSSASSVHSLYTVAIDNHRFRCAGVDEFAHKNFEAFATLGGTGDMSFGSFQGHILVARGETRWKNDGVTTRRWGLPRPIGPPSVSVLDPRIIIASSFDTTETPAWTAKEGTVGAGVGQDDLPEGSRQVTANSSGKAAIEKVFTTAQNYDEFDGGAATGAEEDRIEFYAQISNPDQLEIISLGFDCNPASKAPFQDDYFYQEFTVDEAVEVQLDDKRLLDDRPDVEGIDRDDFFDRHEQPPRRNQTKVRRDTPSANVGWTKFVILRGQMQRVGSTPGCNWSTIKAIQFTFKFTMDSEVAITIGRVKFDGLRILGGSDRTLTGKFRARIVWAREFTEYTALSGPSDESDEIECMNNAIVVTVPGDVSAAKDDQLLEVGGEVWAYIGGGALRSYYRMGTNSASGNGPIAIECIISEREALITNLPMETNNQEPPEDIVGPHGIIGPYFNKILALTQRSVWIGRDGNPDSFWNALDVTDPSERMKWGIINGEEVLIGTTKDIYRLMGSLSELPDGSIDARLVNTGSKPPISEFIAQDGDNFVYLASDGFRMGAGGGSVPINWNLDTLLGSRLDRYGVAPLNLGLAPGKFRGGMANGRLYVLAFESTNELASNIVYVAELGRKYWRREQYPRSLQSLYREPTGIVMAGDSSGCLWLLNTDTSGQGDAFGTQAIAIPAVMHTVSDDNEQPLTMKEWHDWRADMDTGGVVASVQLLMDEVLATTLSVSASGYQTVQRTLGDLSLPRAKRVQHKITGSFFTFRIGNYSVTYRDCPTPMLFWDVLLDFGTLDQVWIREVELYARCSVNMKVQIRFDGEARSLPNDGVVTVRPNVESTYPLEIGRSCHGRIPRAIITPVTTDDDQYAFELYWVRVKARVAGRLTEKTFKVVGPGA